MFELITYGSDDNRIETSAFEDYQSALNAGYSKLSVKSAEYFHVSFPNGNGGFNQLPNGSTLYVGRWNDLTFNDREQYRG